MQSWKGRVRAGNGHGGGVDFLAQFGGGAEPADLAEAVRIAGAVGCAGAARGRADANFSGFYVGKVAASPGFLSWRRVFVCFGGGAVCSYVGLFVFRFLFFRRAVFLVFSAVGGADCVNCSRVFGDVGDGETGERYRGGKYRA